MQSTELSQPKLRKRRKIAWAAFGIFLILAGIGIYAAVHQGVKSIDFKNGTVAFRDVSPAQVQQDQSVLKAAAADANTRAQQQSAPVISAPDISGYWDGSNGLAYYIQQYGDRAVMQEQSPYGITGVAEGVVSSDSATLNFIAINNTTGSAYLTFQSNGSINVQFDNYTTGVTAQVTLTRRSP